VQKGLMDSIFYFSPAEKKQQGPSQALAAKHKLC
jgi:hypothetical protein